MALTTNIVNKNELRVAQLNAFKIAADALTSAFGPYASTTAIRHGETEKNHYGSTTYTKDGHTILKSIIMTRPIEMTVMEDLIRVTRETVKKVGDGTTSAVILSYLIYKGLYDASASGIPESVLVQDIKSIGKRVIDEIDKNKHECTPIHIFEIAMIATNGNVEVSNAIKQIYEKHGMGVYIDVGINNNENHVMKEYDGLTFDKGYYNEGFINNTAKGTCEISKPRVYVFEDPVDTREMRALFDKILYDNIYLPLMKRSQANSTDADIPDVVPTVIFSPAYGHDMKSMADELMEKLSQFPVENKPPFLSVTNINDKQALEDLCYLSGAKLIKKYNDVQNQKDDMDKGLAPTIETIHNFSGTADLVVSDATKTKVINPYMMYDRDTDGTVKKDENGDAVYSILFTNLLNTCTIKLAKLEEEGKELTQIYLLKKRINSLKGNMVEYLIGGVSEADRDATRDLVEDAVLNCRSAATDGYGYGANFEALRVLDRIVKEYQNTDSSIAIMANILFDAYKQLAVILYDSALKNKDEAERLVDVSLKYDRPCNLTELMHNTKVIDFAKNVHDFGNDVLNLSFNSIRAVFSSIKSDEVILNAICKIITISFATNQYLTQAPQYNVYNDEVVVATREK